MRKSFGTCSDPTAVVFILTFATWRRYLRALKQGAQEPRDTCPYSLTDVFGARPYANVPHQQGIRWLTEVFSRSAAKYPHLTALQIPHSGESLTFAELDAHAENMAAAVAPFLTGPDQVVAVAMSQDNWHIVASHLGILRAGGTLMVLDTTLPDALISHMLNDAQPVVILTRGSGQVPRPADAQRPDVARAGTRKNTAVVAGRPIATPRDHLLYQRDNGDAQGRRVRRMPATSTSP